MLLEQNGRWFEADSVGQDRKAELLSVDAERNAEYTGLQFLVPDDGHGKLLDISHYATKDLAEQVASEIREIVEEYEAPFLKKPEYGDATGVTVPDEPPSGYIILNDERRHADNTTSQRTWQFLIVVKRGEAIAELNAGLEACANHGDPDNYEAKLISRLVEMKVLLPLGGK